MGINRINRKINRNFKWCSGFHLLWCCYWPSGDFCGFGALFYEQLSWSNKWSVSQLPLAGPAKEEEQTRGRGSPSPSAVISGCIGEGEAIGMEKENPYPLYLHVSNNGVRYDTALGTLGEVKVKDLCSVTLDHSCIPPPKKNHPKLLNFMCFLFFIFLKMEAFCLAQVST